MLLPAAQVFDYWSSHGCTGEPRAHEKMALCGSVLVGCGQRRRSGGENAAGVQAGNNFC